MPQDLGDDDRHAALGRALKVHAIEVPPRPHDREPQPAPVILCWTHVPAWSPRAGNEVRQDRLLRWLRQQGWRVVLVCCPLEGEEPTEHEARELFRRHPEAALVRRDGEVVVRTQEAAVSAALSRLDGHTVRAHEDRRLERVAGADGLERTTKTYCPDILVDVLRVLEQQLKPAVLMSTYVFMTRALPFLGAGPVRMVDTHDVFSARPPEGIDDHLSMSAEQESILLADADIVIAIQPEEADGLRRLSPRARVITTGVDFPVSAIGPWPREPVVLVVGSGNPLNRMGLAGFLREAWPRVLRLVPGATLCVAGSIGDDLRGDEPGVVRLGRPESLDRAYRDARVVVNPAEAGSGLKIKTVEALAHLRTVVSFPTGAEGIGFELRRFCLIASDWAAFSTLVARALSERPDHSRLLLLHETASRVLSRDFVYAELASELDRVRDAARR